MFTGGVALASAPYPRAQASGGRMEGVCLYRAKTFICAMSYAHTKKADTLIVSAPIVLQSTSQCLVRHVYKVKHCILPRKSSACILDVLQSFRKALNFRAQGLYYIAFRLTLAADPITQRVEHIKLVRQLAELF